MSDNVLDNLEQVRALRKAAEADENYILRCVICKQKVVFLEAGEALEQGHIYSEAGRSEYGISRCCEFCFDNMFAEEPEEEPQLEPMTVVENRWTGLDLILADWTEAPGGKE